MKATEYAKKYANYHTNGMKILSGMVDELLDELFEMAKIRHIKRVESFIDLIREFNVKANKINNLLGEPLINNFFLLFSDKAIRTFHSIQNEKAEK